MRYDYGRQSISFSTISNVIKDWGVEKKTWIFCVSLSCIFLSYNGILLGGCGGGGIVGKRING